MTIEGIDKLSQEYHELEHQSNAILDVKYWIEESKLQGCNIVFYASYDKKRVITLPEWKYLELLQNIDAWINQEFKAVKEKVGKLGL